MAGKGDTFEVDFLKLVLNGTPIPGIADNAASAPLTQLWLALHSADPTESGNQASNEIIYGNYARVAVPRSTSGWVILSTLGDTVGRLGNDTAFPQGVGPATAVATYASVGTAQTGAGKMLWYGPLSPVVSCGNGIVPILAAGLTLIYEL